MKNLLNFIAKHSLSTAMVIGAATSIAIAGFTSFATECERIPDNVLRLHILADSNSEQDQQFKYELRDYILYNFTHELKDCNSLVTAKQKCAQLLPEIERMSREFAHEKNYNYEIKAEVTEMYFTTRSYDSATLPAGDYTALRITIGEGQGENWWCVMFPLLCLPACSENQTVDAISIPEAVTDSPKIKFALFEFMSGLLKVRV